MSKFAAMAGALTLSLAAGQGFAQVQEEHAFAAGAIRIVHPWARAAAAGGETLVFMEIENDGEADVLTGGRTDAAEAVHVVGLALNGGDIGVTEVGEVPVPQGHFELDSGGLALELHGLEVELRQGGHFELVLHFENAGDVAVAVEIEAADARQHSHAGHSH